MIPPEVWFSIILGYLVALWLEKYYISRASVLPHVVVIFFLMWPTWTQINVYVKWYVLIGIFFGIVAFGMLIKKKKIPGWIYDLTYPFYCGKTLMPVYTSIIIFREFFPSHLYLTPFWIVVIILLVTGWYIGIKYLDNNPPFKAFSF